MRTRTNGGQHATHTASVPAQGAPHDHAWRRTSAPEDEVGLLLGRYRCDLCCAVWAL
jgi:hypothetical protein